MFAMILLEIDYFQLLQAVVFFHLTTVTTGVASPADLIFPLELVRPQSRSLESSFNRSPDLLLFLSEGRYFRLLLSHFV